MNTRILPHEEWPRLEVTELPPLLAYVSPTNASIVVVEDKDKLIASMAVLRVSHFEGAWIAPEWRGNAGVVSSLLRHASDIPRERGEGFVFAGAASDQMRNILGRLGGSRMPLDFYALWVGGKECRQQ